MNIFGQYDNVIRTIGFYQPFCSLMLHGKVETRWVRKGRFAAFPLGAYIGYGTKIGCSIEKLKNWCGDEIYGLVTETLCDDNSQHIHGQALWIGNLIKIGTMYQWQEKECFVKHKGIIQRRNKKGEIHDYYQNCLYFENVQAIEPFEFKYGKQGVGIFPSEEKHLIKII